MVTGASVLYPKSKESQPLIIISLKQPKSLTCLNNSTLLYELLQGVCFKELEVLEFKPLY